MDHASELEVVPLSSGIDDIDAKHKPQSHPFSQPIHKPNKQRIHNLPHAIKEKLNDLDPMDCIETLKVASPKHMRKIGAVREFLNVIGPSIGFFGCQFAWACQGGYVDPYLRKLGLPDDMMNYAWILGPISGLIFQPMIGVFSDHCEASFGRRRPFFLAGALILSVCLVLFSHAKGIGNDIFTDETTKSALVLAFICFWFLDFSTNFMEGPLRALCSDTLTESEQLQANSWFGIMNGLASTGGFALGYFTNDIHIIFGVAALVVVSTSLITSYLVTERRHLDRSMLTLHGSDDSSDCELGSGHSNKSNSTDKNKVDAITIPNGVNVVEMEEITVVPLERDNHGTCTEIGGALKEMVFGLSHMPQIVAQCWTVQFCTYFSNFACWVYLTDYFGENIMNGDAVDININSSPHDMIARQKYDLGVEYGNLAFMFIAGISAIFSLFGPRLVEWVGLKRLWVMSLLVYSFVMILSPFIHDLRSALFLFSFIGLPMGASFTLPWAVVSSYSSKQDPNNAGLWLSSLNIAECGPELTVGLLGGLIIDQFKNDVSSVFFMAGIVNLVSVVLVLRVDTSISDSNDHRNSEYDFVDNKAYDDMNVQIEQNIDNPHDNNVASD